MLAAIYGRKSPGQQGACDQEKSVTRQIENAKASAAKIRVDSRRGANLFG